MGIFNSMYGHLYYKYTKDTNTLTINGKCEIIDRELIFNAICGTNKCSQLYTALKTVIFNNESYITTIGINAFSDCRSIENIDIPDSVKTIKNGAFLNCESLKKITLPSGLEYLGALSFFFCSELTGSLILPITLKDRIRQRTFSRCYKLTGTIVIPPNIRIIEESAFSDCKGFDKLILNENLTQIDEAAFINCVGFTEIICKAKHPPKLGKHVFYNINKQSCKLIIPSGIEVMNAYKNAEQWRDFINIS